MLLIVFTALTLALAVAEDGEGCPPIIGKLAFDSQRYEGDWYSIAQSTVNNEEPPLKCVSLHTEGDNTTGTVTFRGIDRKNNAVIKGMISTYVNTLSPEFTANTQAVFKVAGTDTWSPVYDQTVMASDYDNYALITSCRSIFNPETHKFGRDLSVVIIARKPKLNLDILSVLLNLVAGIGVDPANMKMIDHKGCTY